jgi:hypothetical protein
MKSQFLQEPHGATSQKTPFFIFTAVETSNLTTLHIVYLWSKKLSSVMFSRWYQWKISSGTLYRVVFWGRYRLYLQGNELTARIRLTTDGEESLLHRHLHSRVYPLPWRYCWWVIASQPLHRGKLCKVEEHCLQGCFHGGINGMYSRTLYTVHIPEDIFHSMLHIPCKIWGFHSGDYEEWCLLGCYAVWLL